MSEANKNARKKAGAQKFYCPCSGEVRMKTVARGGRLRHVAECLKCGQRKRKPSEF